ncbi:MAG: DNA polymerase III subunit delta' [Hyphomicrobiales bacterium]|nr:DNA polymerase III subunit delta' [Hyphomicrobiales bacterium]
MSAATAKTAAGDAAIEADAIGDLPPPRCRQELVGQAVAEAALLDAYRSGRIHHAWLIGGPRGIGKATLAYRFARFVLAHPDPYSAAVQAASDLYVDPESSAAHKVAAGSHPDLLVLSRRYDPDRKRFTTGIPVDTVRRTVSFFGSTAAEGGWRIAVVDAADDMNASAANAILKILEEPPERSLFLLISHQPGRLLPTIRSRCRRIGLGGLEPTDIREALLRFGVAVDHTDTELELAGMLAEGSLRRAIILLENDGIALYRAFREIVDGLPKLDIAALHAFADKVGGSRNEDAYEIFLDLLRGWLHRRVRGQGEPSSAAAKPAGTRHQTALVSWAEVWEKVARSAGLAESLNLDRKQVVLSSIRALAEAARQG